MKLLNKVLIATMNPGKVNDFKVLFEPQGIEVVSLLDLAEPIEDIEETGVTFAENAAIKAETIAEMMQMPVVSDDSGLSIDALNGEPGVYSARYAGLDKDDQKNIDKVLKKLRDVSEKERTAKFVCAMALAEPGKATIIKHGYCEGFITNEMRGTHGFGYDPIFQPVGYDKTMAELSPEEKSAISHRGQALKQLQSSL